MQFFKKSVLFVLLLSFVFIFGCAKEQGYKGARLVMGTVWEITAYGDKAACLEAIEEAFKEVERVSKVFSIFDENSEVSIINKTAGISKIKLSDEAYDLIGKSIYFSEISGGVFDITITPLMRMWGFVDRKPRVPTDEEIKRALDLVGYENIVLDEKTKEISFKKNGVELDFGAIAKGYGVDRAVLVLKKYGIQSALVNGGGNIYCIGAPPGKNFWNIGIKDPLTQDRILKTIELKDQAVATSGGYENYFIINGKKYCHIIDPRTGMPCEGILSATVIAEDATTADALSTACFVLGKQKGEELLRKVPGARGIILE